MNEAQTIQDAKNELGEIAGIKAGFAALQKEVYDEGFSDLADQKEAILRKLEELRSRRKMKAADVAALLGRSPSYYSVMLNRDRSLSLDSLAKIAALFDRKIELRLVRRKG